VREAVVTARRAPAGVGGEGGALGDVTLVAYVTAAESAAPELETLQRELARTLPAYMIPSVLVALPAMPLTASGKVDRKALPAPEQGARAERVREAPRTELERLLARLWSEVLSGMPLESIGVEDSFFQIGGNSITGAIFINRLQAELREIVHVVTLFDAPTVRQLAQYLTDEYPKAVARLTRMAAAGGATGAAARVDRIGRRQIDEVRALIRQLPPAQPGEAAGPLNPRALFVL